MSEETITSGTERAYETIRYDVAGPIATITLDRPERLNAFTEPMLVDVVDALDRADADDDVRVIVFTGAGRAFCAGADLGGAGDTFARATGEPFDMARHADGGGVLGRRLLDAAKPVIAAINGPAVGIGLTMTLSMDIRLVVDSAKLGFVFAKRGIVPETSAAFHLPRIVGHSQAAEWLYTGRIFRPDEALAAGLVRSVHPAGELLDAAYALATEIATGTSAMSVALTRRMLWQLQGGGSDPVLAHELDSEALYFVGSAADANEGVTAFLDKREPAFPLRVSRDLPPFWARWGQERGGLHPDAAGDATPYDRMREAQRAAGGGPGWQADTTTTTDGRSA